MLIPVRTLLGPRDCLASQGTPVGPRRLDLIVVLLALAPGCKKDQSKPGPTPSDAAPVAQSGSALAGSGLGSDGGPAIAPTAGATDAGAATASSATDDKPPATDDKPPATDDKPPAVDKPINLKVLPRSWSLARVETYMKKQVARGTGMKCEGCHDKDDYAADGNDHKKAARRMVILTRALNRQYFRKKPVITCFTCHKGKEHL